MSYFIISSILNALSSVWVCLFVFLSNRKSKTNQTFAYYAFFVAFWATCFFLWITATTKEEALFYIRLATMGALFIPSTLLHFTCYLLNEYKKYAPLIKLLYIIDLLTLPIGLTPLYIIDTEQQYIFPFWPMAGKFYIILAIKYFIGIGFSLFLIYKNIKITTGFKRQQLKYVFWGILIAYLGGATCFPLSYHIPIPPFAIILISVYSIFVMYAIFKYQLMDIKIILKRSLVYSVLIAIMTIFYFISIYLMEHFFQEMFKYRSFFVSLTLGAIITLAFIPLKNFIQSFIEKYLFKGSYMQIAEENELLRQEIIQTEKLKSVSILASGMAHEIKNPLTVLKTFSEFLPNKLDDKAFLKNYAHIVTREVHRIDDLVHELLDFAKPAPVQLKPTDIHDLLDHTLDLLSIDLVKHKINITKNYQLEQNLRLNLDANQFKQALLNLFLNAIEAMPHNGELLVSTNFSVLSDSVTIKIQDSGIGIAKEDLTHIFDPFFTKKDHGTGLGLSITHEIIKNHNGKIFAESQKGKGSTFIIELPI